MNYNQFKNLSCYEEFEIQCALIGISKIDVLKEICHKIDNYYFFISNDGIFNWFDLYGNHVEDPGVLKELKDGYIPKTITKCIIPNSVTNIGNGVFWDCESLKEITIPNSVTGIGSRAFYYCKSLEEITIPNSVTSISNSAFYYCVSLTSITIPDNVISIGNYTFSCCKSLKEITIPNSVTSVGIGTFYGCNSLKELIFKNKTLKEVKRMEYYPFSITNESIIKFS